VAMGINEILTLLGGLSISVIGYFLKETMSDLKSVKSISFETKTKLQVLETEYMNKIERLNEKFDLLYDAIEKLTNKIETLQDRI
jgi:hypothetical protein